MLWRLWWAGDERVGRAGFTKRDESEYDPFGAGHSSTSVSAALGMAVARDFKVPTPVGVAFNVKT